MTELLQRCTTHGMVPFQNFKGFAVTPKKSMAGIQNLCKKTSPYLLTMLTKILNLASFR